MMTSHFGGPPSGARVTGTEPATIGEGGLWTTPVDLERWNQAMYVRAFGATAPDLAETSARLRDGSFMAIAWGRASSSPPMGLLDQLVHDAALQIAAEASASQESYGLQAAEVGLPLSFHSQG